MTMRFVGQDGDVAVSVVDLKCDVRAIEWTAVGPGDGDTTSLMPVAEKIEAAAGIVNFTGLSEDDRVQLSNTGHFEWSKGSKHGEIFLQRTDVSIIVTAYFQDDV